MTPEKLRYTLQILAPLAFLPLRRWWLAASLVPGAVLTLLTTEYGPTLDIGYQYGCDFVPYVFPAVALALAWLRRPDGQPGSVETTAGAPVIARAPVNARAAAATFALATVLATAVWGAFPPRKTFHSSYGFLSFAPPTPEEQRRLAALDAAMRLVPRDAVLAASDRELPHVSNRIECWNLAVGWSRRRLRHLHAHRPNPARPRPGGARPGGRLDLGVRHARDRSAQAPPVTRRARQL